MSCGSLALVVCLALFSACGGVEHVIRRDVGAPLTIAVLPFEGAADSAVRESARALMHSRLQAHGYHMVEMAWVDRVLAERGWLRDPVNFDADARPLPEVIAALGVDAVAIGRDLEETSFNILILRRHAFGGRVLLQRQDGVWWAADHSAGKFGGFLLTSGQVFEELRAQGTHGTSMAALALVDEFVTDIAATVPHRDATGRQEVEPTLAGVTMKRSPRSDGQVRHLVEARATPGSALRFELLPHFAGVPMVALRGRPGHYRGAVDLPASTALDCIAVCARSRFGREVRVEVMP